MATKRNSGKKSTDETADADPPLLADPTVAPGASATAGAGTPTAPKPGKAVKKPKFPCGKCDLEVTCGVVCNSCDVWFHDKCV